MKLLRYSRISILFGYDTAIVRFVIMVGGLFGDFCRKNGVYLSYSMHSLAFPQ